MKRQLDTLKSLDFSALNTDQLHLVIAQVSLSLV
jgi:hypothetical protein